MRVKSISIRMLAPFKKMAEVTVEWEDGTVLTRDLDPNFAGSTARVENILSTQLARRMSYPASETGPR